MIKTVLIWICYISFSIAITSNVLMWLYIGNYKWNAYFAIFIVSLIIALITRSIVEKIIERVKRK